MGTVIAGMSPKLSWEHHAGWRRKLWNRRVHSGALVALETTPRGERCPTHPPSARPSSLAFDRMRSSSGSCTWVQYNTSYTGFPFLFSRYRNLLDSRSSLFGDEVAHFLTTMAPIGRLMDTTKRRTSGVLALQHWSWPKGTRPTRDLNR